MKWDDLLGFVMGVLMFCLALGLLGLALKLFYTVFMLGWRLI